MSSTLPRRLAVWLLRPAHSRFTFPSRPHRLQDLGTGPRAGRVWSGGLHGGQDRHHRHVQAVVRFARPSLRKPRSGNTAFSLGAPRQHAAPAPRPPLPLRKSRAAHAWCRPSGSLPAGCPPARLTLSTRLTYQHRNHHAARPAHPALHQRRIRQQRLGQDLCHAQPGHRGGKCAELSSPRLAASPETRADAVAILILLRVVSLRQIRPGSR